MFENPFKWSISFILSYFSCNCVRKNKYQDDLRSWKTHCWWILLLQASKCHLPPHKEVTIPDAGISSALLRSLSSIWASGSEICTIHMHCSLKQIRPLSSELYVNDHISYTGHLTRTFFPAVTSLHLLHKDRVTSDWPHVGQRSHSKRVGVMCPVFYFCCIYSIENISEKIC